VKINWHVVFSRGRILKTAPIFSMQKLKKIKNKNKKGNKDWHNFCS